MKRTTRFLYTAFMVFAVLAAAGGEIYAQTSNPALMRAAERQSGDKFTVFVKTQKGANVYGVRQPSAATLTAIDKGLDDLFAVSAKNNYRARLRHADYTIFIARADRQTDSAGNYSPAIAISAGQYAGSEYDKGGYVYAAGMVIAYTPCAFIVAEHTKNLNAVSDIVRYEGEHIVLYHNDRQRYRETADHSRGGGHPILN